MYTKETFSLSLIINIILTFIIPASISQPNGVLEYSFGFPFNYFTFYQIEHNSNFFFLNFFAGNNGIKIDLMFFILNLLFFNFLIHLVVKTYKKYTANPHVKLNRKK